MGDRSTARVMMPTNLKTLKGLGSGEKVVVPLMLVCSSSIGSLGWLLGEPMSVGRDLEQQV
jgi:hypothetical protein